MVPENESSRNADVRRVIERTRKIIKKDLKKQLRKFTRAHLKRYPQEIREALYESYEAQYHTELPDDEMKELLNTLMARVCPERLIMVEPKPVDEPNEFE